MPKSRENMEVDSNGKANGEQRKAKPAPRTVSAQGYCGKLLTGTLGG